MGVEGRKERGNWVLCLSIVCKDIQRIVLNFKMYKSEFVLSKLGHAGKKALGYGIISWQGVFHEYKCIRHAC